MWIAPEATDLTYNRLLDPAEPMHCALMLQDDECAGFVHFIYHRSTWTSGDYCYLQDLFVSDDKRGRGPWATVDGARLSVREGRRGLPLPLAHPQHEHRRNAALRPHRRALELRAVSRTPLVYFQAADDLALWARPLFRKS